MSILRMELVLGKNTEFKYAETWRWRCGVIENTLNRKLMVFLDAGQKTQMFPRIV